MKIAVILLVFLSTQSATLQLRGIKDKYEQNEEIQYSVCNSQKGSLFLNITLEAYIQHKWQEISLDITHQSFKSARLYNLKGDSCKQFSYSIKKIDKSLLKKQLAIRLKIYYQSKLGSVQSILYSKKICVAAD